MTTRGRTRRVPKRLDCHERALGLLAVRPRSARELRSRLLRAGFEGPEVDEELRRLESVGLVDDAAFALQLAEHEIGVRRSSGRAAASRLAAKGVDRSTIQEAVRAASGDPESERALELARSRVTRLSGVAPERAYARLVGFLARRGYDAGVARDAARSALGGQTDLD